MDSLSKRLTRHKKNRVWVNEIWNGYLHLILFSISTSVDICVNINLITNMNNIINHGIVNIFLYRLVEWRFMLVIISDDNTFEYTLWNGYHRNSISKGIV